MLIHTAHPKNNQVTGTRFAVVWCSIPAGFAHKLQNHIPSTNASEATLKNMVKQSFKSKSIAHEEKQYGQYACSWTVREEIELMQLSKQILDAPNVSRWLNK